MLVLITEDLEDLREMTKMLLESDGYSVATASNGLEAVAVALTHSPDIILMDLHMPVMDGFAATQELRRRAETRDIPIIAVSAYLHEKAWCDRAMAAGVNECISKPLDCETLHAVVAKYTHQGP